MTPLRKFLLAIATIIIVVTLIGWIAINNYTKQAIKDYVQQFNRHSTDKIEIGGIQTSLIPYTLSLQLNNVRLFSDMQQTTLSIVAPSIYLSILPTSLHTIRMKAKLPKELQLTATKGSEKRTYTLTFPKQPIIQATYYSDTFSGLFSDTASSGSYVSRLTFEEAGFNLAYNDKKQTIATSGPFFVTVEHQQGETDPDRKSHHMRLSFQMNPNKLWKNYGFPGFESMDIFAIKADVIKHNDSNPKAQKPNSYDISSFHYNNSRYVINTKGSLFYLPGRPMPNGTIKVALLHYPKLVDELIRYRMISPTKRNEALQIMRDAADRFDSDSADYTIGSYPGQDIRVGKLTAFDIVTRLQGSQPPRHEPPSKPEKNTTKVTQ